MDQEPKHTDDVAYFISFCIEIFKKSRRLSGGEVSVMFREKGLTEYLERNYDVLHTQSPQWILEEINSYLDDR